jgi:hypothetical protein
MMGVYTETMSQGTCPICTGMGKPDSRLYHYSVAEGPLAILQLRCHICRHVKTIVNSVTPEALKAAREIHRRGRSLLYTTVAALIMALSIITFAAVSTAAP